MAKHIPMYVSQLDPSFTSFRAEDVDARDIALQALEFIDGHLIKTRKFRTEEARHIERDRVAGFLEAYLLKTITGGLKTGDAITQAIEDFTAGLASDVPVVNTAGKLDESPELEL